MQEIKSGKALCDEFFSNLSDHQEVDVQVANILKELYASNNLSKDKILKGLELLRQGKANEIKN